MLDLYDVVDSQIPQFNKKIADGLVVSEIKQVEDYVHRLFLQAAQNYPPGLEYIGYSRCDPKTVYNKITERSKNKAGKNVYEFSESNIYLMQYDFKLNGVLIEPVYIYLPYVKDGGIITIKGSNYSISPVLADMSLSVGQDNIFIYMNKSKITWRQFLHHYMVDGETKSEYVVWSRAHNNGIKATTLSRKTSNIHYLFCKYGLTKTFSKYGNANVTIGYDEINTINFPPEEYVITSSTRLKPPGKNGKYFPSGIRLAIPKSQFNHITSGMIVAFFYIVDHFPDRVTPDMIDNLDIWCILLGHCIFKTNDSEGKLLNNISTHLTSVDSFVDGMVKDWLSQDNIIVDDIYDLFAYVSANFSSRISYASKTLASMYNKRLLVLRYMLFDLTDGIFNTMFDVNKLARNSAVLKEKEVKRIFRRRLKPRLVTFINRKHAEVSSISSSSDNLATKITSNVVMQSNMAGTTTSKAKGAVFDDSKAIDASIAEVGSYNNLPKSDITGRGRINMFVRIRHDNSIERNPYLKDMLDNVQRLIARD